MTPPVFDSTSRPRIGPGQAGRPLAAGTVPVPVPVPDGVVFGDPGARAGFRRAAVRLLRLPAILATILLPGGVLIGVTAGQPLPLLLAAGLVAAVAGVRTGQVRRLYRIGASTSWVPYTTVVYDRTALMRDETTGAQRLLLVGRYPEWLRRREITMWLAEGPAGAVLTVPGGGPLALIPTAQSTIGRRQAMTELIRRALPPAAWPVEIRSAGTAGLVTRSSTWEADLATRWDLLALYRDGVATR